MERIIGLFFAFIAFLICLIALKTLSNMFKKQNIVANLFGFILAGISFMSIILFVASISYLTLGVFSITLSFLFIALIVCAAANS